MSLLFPNNQRKLLALGSVIIITVLFVIFGTVLSFFSGLTKMSLATSQTVDLPLLFAFYVFLFYCFAAALPFFVALCLFHKILILKFIYKGDIYSHDFRLLAVEDIEYLLQFSSIAVIVVFMMFFTITRLSIQNMKNNICQKPISTYCPELTHKFGPN
jgi:hypothetical protein